MQLHPVESHLEEGAKLGRAYKTLLAWCRTKSAWGPAAWYLKDCICPARMWNTKSIGLSLGDLVGKNTVSTFKARALIIMVFQRRSSTISASRPVWMVVALSIIKTTLCLNHPLWIKCLMKATKQYESPFPPNYPFNLIVLIRVHWNDRKKIESMTKTTTCLGVWNSWILLSDLLEFFMAKHICWQHLFRRGTSGYSCLGTYGWCCRNGCITEGFRWWTYPAVGQDLVCESCQGGWSISGTMGNKQQRCYHTNMCLPAGNWTNGRMHRIVFGPHC